MMDTILVAIGPNDGEREDQLLDRLTDIADTETTITLAHIFDTDNYGYTSEATETLRELGYNLSNPPSPDEYAARNTTILNLKTELVDAGYDVTIRGRMGDDYADKIIDIADEEDADNIVVCGRKRSPTGKVLFGSVAQRIMLDAPCPVTLVREDRVDRTKPLRNLL